MNISSKQNSNTSVNLGSNKLSIAALIKRFAACCLLLMIGMLAGCSVQKDPVSIASHVWPGYEFLHLADSLKLIDGSLVTYTNTNSATESLDLIVENKVDMAALTLDEVIQARARGADLAVIAVFDISAGADMVIARTENGTPIKLEGARVGVETTALGALVLSQFLNSQGLTPSDITVVPLTIDQQEAAWRADRVDAVITYEPVASRLIEQGGAAIYDSREMPEMILDVLAVRKDALAKEEQIGHLLEGHFAALNHFEIQPQDAYYRMSARLGVMPEQVYSLFNGLVLPDLANNERLFAGSSSVVSQAGEKVFEVMVEQELVDPGTDISGLFDTRILDSLGEDR